MPIFAPHARGAPRRHRGFTLTELMIVLALAGVLIAAALPNFNQFVRNQRVKTASFDLISSLTMARSEAITRNASVTVTPTGGSWANGWQVTVGAVVVRSQSSVAGITITGPASITYNGNGRLAAAVAAIELTASGSAITARCISVDLSGRPVSKASVC